jgi:hypothetical protein
MARKKLKKHESRTRQTVFVFEPTAKVLPLAVKTNDGLVLNGHEDLATEIRDRAQRIEILAKQQKEEGGKLIKVVKSFRMKAEIEGNFHKSVDVVCKTGKPVKVVFGDSYKEVDVKHEDTLQSALGKRYAEFFGRFVKVAARDDLTLARLKEVLGDKFDAFCGLVQVDEYLAPTKNFMENRAGIRPDLSAEMNEKIDNLIAQVQNAPAIKTK